MRTLRRILPLALPCALVCTFASAASAQADIAITSPDGGAYVNDTTPTVSFSGAIPSTTVTLYVDGTTEVGTADSGSGTATVTSSFPVTT